MSMCELFVYEFMCSVVEIIMILSFDRPVASTLKPRYINYNFKLKIFRK